MSGGTDHEAEGQITDRFAVLDMVEDCGLAGVVAAWEVMDRETWSFISEAADQDPHEPESMYMVAMALLVGHTSYSLDMASTLSVAGVDLDVLFNPDDPHNHHPILGARAGILALGKLDHEGYRWKVKDFTQVMLRVESVQAGIRAERTKGEGNSHGTSTNSDQSRGGE